MTETQRWEVGILIGPCTQNEAERFLEEASDLVYENVAAKHGAVFGLSPWDEEAELATASSARTKEEGND